MPAGAFDFGFTPPRGGAISALSGRDADMGSEVLAGWDGIFDRWRGASDLAPLPRPNRVSAGGATVNLNLRWSEGNWPRRRWPI